MQDIHKEYRDNSSVEDILINGLVTDGAHHKQWFLYQALIKITGSKGEALATLASRHNCSVEQFVQEYDASEFMGIPD